VHGLKVSLRPGPRGEADLLGLAKQWPRHGGIVALGLARLTHCGLGRPTRRANNTWHTAAGGELVTEGG
jgi:hypothetical protein